MDLVPRNFLEVLPAAQLSADSPRQLRRLANSAQALLDLCSCLAGAKLEGALVSTATT